MSDRPTLIAAVDFATNGNAICLQTAGLARRLGARVLLLHVIQLPTGLQGGATVRAPGSEGPTTAAEMLQRDAEKHLAPLEDLMRMHGADVEVLIRHGRVVAELARLAEERPPLLVVVGSDFVGGVRRLVQRSVTEEIIRELDVPVLVVKGDPDAERVMSTGQMQAASENDG